MYKPILSRLAASVAVVAVAAGASNALPLAEMTIDVLKQTYLRCERQAQYGAITSEEMMYCSIVYEELKDRAFDGEWKRVWHWTNQNIAGGYGI